MPISASCSRLQRRGATSYTSRRSQLPKGEICDEHRQLLRPGIERSAAPSLDHPRYISRHFTLDHES